MLRTEKAKGKRSPRTLINADLSSQYGCGHITVLPVETLPDNLNYSFCYKRLSQSFTNCSVNLRTFKCFILVLERTMMTTKGAQLNNMGHLLSLHNFCNKPFSLKTGLSIKVNIRNGDISILIDI